MKKLLSIFAIAALAATAACGGGEEPQADPQEQVPAGEASPAPDATAPVVTPGLTDSAAAVTPAPAPAAPTDSASATTAPAATPGEAAPAPTP